MLTYAISVFNIMKYLNSKGLVIELTFEIISFGIVENSGLINFIIFLMKYFIFFNPKYKTEFQILNY